jgi:hypothetical protein
MSCKIYNITIDLLTCIVGLSYTAYGDLIHTSALCILVIGDLHAAPPGVTSLTHKFITRTLIFDAVRAARSVSSATGIRLEEYTVD